MRAAARLENLFALFLVGAVQFASVSEPGSGKARKRVEQPSRMAVAGKERYHSAKRVALAYRQVI